MIFIRRQTIDKIFKVISHYFLLGVVFLLVIAFYYSFQQHRMWTIFITVIFGLVLWILDWVRPLAFRFDKIFKNVNHSFWDFMMLVNKFFNFAIIRYSLAILVFVMFIYSAFMMLSLVA